MKKLLVWIPFIGFCFWSRRAGNKHSIDGLTSPKILIINGLYQSITIIFGITILACLIFK